MKDLRFTLAFCLKHILLLSSVLWLVACTNSAHVPVLESQTVNRSPIAVPERYVVQKGDSLYAIASRYGLNFRQLAELNGISAPYIIYPGNVLHLKTVKTPTTKPKVAPPVNVIAKKPSAVETAPPARVVSAGEAGKSTWIWPISGKIERGFTQDGLSKGVDIVAAIGTAVKSTRDGQVIYAGNKLKGYGNLIIVRHDDIYLSAYAHNRVIRVSEGQVVKQGDVIAESGMSGTQSPKLHFEIRRSGKPIDPLSLLPK